MRMLVGILASASLVACGNSSSNGTDGGGDDDTGDGGARHDGATGGHDAPGVSSLTPGTSTLNLTVAGTARTAQLYVPTGLPAKAPLVIALHGDGDSDTNFLATSGLKPLADSQHLVLIVPQGITRDVTVKQAGGEVVPSIDWDAYNSAADGNIDLPLLEKLRTELQATGQIDNDHTFVFGYSQGGYMSFLYGLSDATVLSCAGVLAASSPFGGASNDPLITGAARKIAVALQIGTEDDAFSAAQTTAASLTSAGFPNQFKSIQGAGHVPIPGDISVPLAFCLGQTL